MSFTTETLRSKGFIETPSGFRRVAPDLAVQLNELEHSQKASNLSVGLDSRRFVLFGQVRGGKNNLVVTRSGKRFPKKSWKIWRDDAVRSIHEQIPRSFKQIKEPCNVRITYVAGDKRRRDMPAILDSIFHIFERAGVVADDSLIWVSESSRSYSKTSPHATIEFLKVIQ